MNVCLDNNLCAKFIQLEIFVVIPIVRLFFNGSLLYDTTNISLFYC